MTAVYILNIIHINVMIQVCWCQPKSNLKKLFFFRFFVNIDYFGIYIHCKKTQTSHHYDKVGVIFHRNHRPVVM